MATQSGGIVSNTYEIWAGASRYDKGLDMVSALDARVMLEEVFPGVVFDIVSVTRAIVSAGNEMRRVA